MSLFSPPDYLKGREGGGGARPLAVAGSSGAGGLDLERMQARLASANNPSPQHTAGRIYEECVSVIFALRLRKGRLQRAPRAGA